MVRASLAGSSVSSAFGRPWATSQNGQRRVQMSPMIMNVAVPLPKHSDRFGQLASSQTVCRPLARSAALTLATSADSPSLARIQFGLRSGLTVGSTLIGMRAIFSAARSFTPTTIGAGGAGWATGGDWDTGEPDVSGMPRSLRPQGRLRRARRCYFPTSRAELAQAAIESRASRAINVRIESGAMALQIAVCAACARLARS